MDTAAVARLWIDGWTRGWSAHDTEPIAALYAPDAVFVSHPFREPQAPADYAAWPVEKKSQIRHIRVSHGSQNSSYPQKRGARAEGPGGKQIEQSPKGPAGRKRARSAGGGGR